MENLLFILNIWLVLTALWLLITFRKFALGGAGATLLQAIIFAALAFGLMRLLESASALLAADMAVPLLLPLRAVLIGTIVLVTLVKTLRRRARRGPHATPTIL